MDAPDPTIVSPTSPAPATPSSSASRSASRPMTSFAFLVHSQESVTNKLAPEVDNKALARQRRRRTSPEDQAILEYEFARDSKPDKVSRARIAARVALGEKEVQIWFQNRRSTARRRSGPFIPPGHFSPVQGNDDDLDPQLSQTAVQPSQGAEFTNDDWSAFVGRAATQHGTQHALEDADRDDGNDDNRKMAASLALAEEAEDAKTGQQTRPMMFSSSSSSSQHKHTTATAVRLSLTSDGGARILASDESTPSPPRLSPSSSSLSSHSLLSSVSSSSRAAATSVTAFTDAIAKDCDNSGTRPGDQRARSSITVLGAPSLSLSSFSLHPYKESSEKETDSLGNLSRSGRCGSGGRSGSRPLLDGSPSKRRAYARQQQQSSLAGIRRKSHGGSVIAGTRGRSRDSRAWEFWCDQDSRNDLAKHAEQDQKGHAADAIELIRSAAERRRTRMTRRKVLGLSSQSGPPTNVESDVAKPKPKLRSMEDKENWDPSKKDDEMGCAEGLLSLSQGAWQ